ncbi:glycoside hydrolase family 6 protein [Curtobacterium sp. Leaf261]|uniref:glycoside hydrolase family 6 protein n=1 Tax=Curtobacterium sp. Leaf261 TaxID=1736311 RepID=UPI0006FA6CEF|nr:glycoside hydrolase family 6 protein [Curtobacterium sp. Leaf261]KQO62181.1 hypothetical protein ASF23_10150 [Curtobacterium sp. Leaf261]
MPRTLDTPSTAWMTRATVLVALAVAVVAATILPAVAAPAGAAPAAAAAPVTGATIRTASASTVFSGGPYLQPSSTPARYAASLAASGDSAGSAAAATIARYPIAIWLGDWYSDAQLTQLLTSTQTAAAAAGTTPVYVTYAIPNRDCGGYSAGGMTATAYEAWTDRIATTLRGQRAVVVVEPDALAALSNCPAEAATRYTLLQHEVRALAAAGVPSYIDAGNSNWVPPAEMAARLVKAGVDSARGFATNVSNYYPTATEQAYADRVSAMTGGSHYVIDTSRNGQGWRGTWCNPPGAGLGTPPAVADGSTALDARLWIKTPGASDGTCNGGPVAGAWFASYAQGLVANRAPAPATAPATTSPVADQGATPTAAPTAAPTAKPTATAAPTASPKPSATPSPSAPAPAVSDTMRPVSSLTTGQSIARPNGVRRLVMQADGNLVVYIGTRGVWSTGTSRSPGATLRMQADGNLVLYARSGTALWSSGTSRLGGSGMRLVIQPDGNLVLYKNSTAVWSSGTRG